MSREAEGGSNKPAEARGKLTREREKLEIVAVRWVIGNDIDASACHRSDFSAKKSK